MKNKLITIASALALLVVLARVFERPLLAQIPAALTQNVDEPGRNPFSLYSDGLPGNPTVASWTVPYNGGLNEMTDAVGHFVGAGLSSGTTVYTCTGTAHLYADAGIPIYAIAFNGGTGEASDHCGFYVNGYVINNP